MALIGDCLQTSQLSSIKRIVLRFLSAGIRSDNLVHVDPQDVPPDRNAYLKAGEIIVVRSGANTGDSAIIPLELAGCVAGYDMVVSVARR